MAILFPSLETIKNLRPYPTEWELTLIWFLVENLSDDFEVYFQPFLNGDMPDIIIMKKNAWVIIIEVKDWVFKNYYIDEEKNWRLQSNKAYLKSPFAQVNKYKENLFNLHINELLTETIYKKSIYSIISTLVYFHCETEEEIMNFTGYEMIDEAKYPKYLWWDSLNSDVLSSIIKKFRLDVTSTYFTDEIYESFKRYLKPPLHVLEQWEFLSLTKNQEELSKSAEPYFRKIKGVAGSWKTIILANRAVNAHKRHKDKVLILTYNITLKNYIHDNISKVRAEFNWENFYINSYHSFITTELNNLWIRINVPEWIENTDTYLEENYYSNMNLLEWKTVKKYKTILIDEWQDYKEEWFRILQKYFLEEWGEFIVFWDEKQNVYERKLDEDKKVSVPWMRWGWKTLKESFRLSEGIAKLSTEFQMYYFKDKYDFEEIKTIEKQQSFDFQKWIIEHHFLDETFSGVSLLDSIWDIVVSTVKKKNISPNDICFVSSDIKWIRVFEKNIRNKTKEKHTIMFETHEEFKEIQSKSNNEAKLKKECDRVRKGRKWNFWLNAWTMKFSSIHSFKWLEADTLFLIINSKDDNDELIYTSMTRARNNLVIINVNNTRYKEFFYKNTELINSFII